MALIQAAAQQQQQGMQKLMKLTMDLQKANAEANEQARQSAGGAVAETLNAVTQGMERERQERQRVREKSEDKEFAVEMAEFQQTLAKDLQMEGQRVGNEMQASRDAALDFVQRYKAQKQETNQAITAGYAKLDALANGGYFDHLPDGVDRYAQMKGALDMAEARADDHFSDANLSRVYSMMDQAVRDIQAGQAPMDLRTLQVDPLLLPNPKPVEVRGNPGRGLTPDEIFRMKMTGGYPMGGTVFADRDPTEPDARVFDPKTFTEALFYDSTLTQLTDRGNRAKLKHKIAMRVAEANERLVPMMERYEDTNRIMNTMAPNAVARGIEEFAAQPGTGKFDNMPRNLFFLAMKNMYPERGEELAAMALDVFDGKREFKTAEQYWVGMGLESAAFNVQQHLSDALQQPIQRPGEKGATTMALVLAQQIQDQVGPEGLGQFLGVEGPVDAREDGPGMITAQRMMTRRLIDTKSFAQRVHRGLWQESALEQFREQLASNLRMADVVALNLAFGEQGDREKAAQKVQEVLGQVAAGAPERVAGMGPQAVQTSLAQGSEFDLNIMDSMILLAAENGRDALTEMAVAVTGGAESIDSPNLEAYRAIFDQEARRSGDSRYDIERTRRNFDVQQRAKELAQVQKERGLVGAGTEAVKRAPGAVAGAVQSGQQAVGGAAKGFFEGAMGALGGEAAQPGGDQ
jgi:hypothetical protein